MIGPSLVGCASADYIQLKDYHHAPKAVSEVDLIPKGEKPPCESETVGQMTGYNSATETGAQSAMIEMREKAASLGADGVKDFECGAPGTTGAHNCSGFVYVCKAAEPNGVGTTQ